MTGARTRPVRGSAACRLPRLAARTWLLALVPVWLLMGGAAFATTYLQRSPQAMLGKADLVFVGTVSEVQVTNDGGTPWTHVRFAVDTALEGVPTNADGKAEQPVELAFLGGTVPGGPALTVGGMPQFQVGEKVLLFAYNQAYASPIVGFRQALWRITPAGLRDEDGRLLSLSGDGTLVSGGSGAPLEAIVTAIRTSLGSGSSTP